MESGLVHKRQRWLLSPSQPLIEGRLRDSDWPKTGGGRPTR